MNATRLQLTSAVVSVVFAAVFLHGCLFTSASSNCFSASPKNGCLTTATNIDIRSVTPGTINHGSKASVTVTTTDIIPKGSEVYLSPGGPHITHSANDSTTVDFVALYQPHSQQHNEQHQIQIIATASRAGHIRLQVMDNKSFKTLSTYTTEHPIDHIKIHEDTLYVAEKGAGLGVYHIEKNYQLKPVQHYKLKKTINDIQVDNQNIYLLYNQRSIISISRLPPLTGIIERRTFNAGTVNSIAVRGDYIYATGPELGLGVFSFPMTTKKTATMILLDKLATTGTGEQVVLQDNLAWAADGHNGTVVFDISTPGKILWHSSHNKIGSVDSLIPDHTPSHIQGNKMAIVKNTSGRLVSLNTGNTELPVTGSFFKGASTVKQFVRNGRIVFAATNNGLQRIDFSVAANQQISDEGINLGGSRRAFIKDNIAYVADWFSGLHLYDISKPGQPRHLGNYHTPGSSKGVVVKDHHAIVADDDHGLQIVDVSNPAKPVWVAELLSTGLAYTMKLVDDRLYLADHRGGFHIIDVSNVTKPKHLAAWDTSGKSWAIDVVGNHAFVADDTSGLQIFDISDIQHIKQVGQFNPGGQAEDVMIRDGIAYVAFFDKGLYLLDISNPVNPVLLGHTPVPGNARSIRIQPRNNKLFAYVAGWESGLQVVDITDSRKPFIAGHIDTSGSAWGADVNGDHAWVWDWWGGIKAVDISNPTQPALVGKYQSRGKIEKLSISGNYMFSASGNGGLQVFDINNPLNPVWQTGINLPGYAHDVSTTNNRTVVALGEAGIAVLDTRQQYYVDILGNFASANPALKVRATDKMIYALDDQGSLLRIDASDPAHLSLEDTLTLQASDLWLDDGWLYTTGPGTSLRYIQLTGRRLSTMLMSGYGGGGHIQSGTSPAPLVRDTISREWSLVRAQGETVAVYENGSGIHLFKRRQNSIRQISTVVWKSPVTDMALHDGQLMFYAPDKGLVSVDISDLASPVITTLYPATGNHQGFVINGDAAFFSGESTIASTDLLPGPGIRQHDNTHVSVDLPDNMPLGSYHLLMRQPDGQVSESGNAIHVRPKPRKKPKFSMDDFRKIMKQRK